MRPLTMGGGGRCLSEGGDMEYRGVRYLILTRIERGQWSVKIYPGTGQPLERIITGTRNASKMAELMIDQWLEKHGQC
jgi:hypothetical protein